jgi:hypothetical protein
MRTMELKIVGFRAASGLPELIQHTCLSVGGGEFGFSTRGARVGDNSVSIPDSIAGPRSDIDWLVEVLL